MRRATAALFVASILAWLAAPAPARAGERQPAPDGVTRLLERFQDVIAAGDPARVAPLLADGADAERAGAFSRSLFVRKATRVVVRERDRAAVRGWPAGSAYRVLLEVFVESGARARLSTCQMEVTRRGAGSDEWVISGAEITTSFGALHRLTLGTKQYAAKDLVLVAEDLEVRLPEGSVFTAETDEGVTALVLVGKGQILFRPRPETEREQMRLFSGAEMLDTAFSTAFIRFAPGTYSAHVGRGSLVARTTDPRQFAQASETFRLDSVKSFQVGLGDLSPDNWWIAPGYTDFLAEVHTKRFGPLTYTRAARDAEDVSLFDRAHRRNISVYASADKLAKRGRFYGDDDQADYDVVHYDIQAAFDPVRQAIDATAMLTLVVRNDGVATVTLRLAESLDVASIVSREFGRLFAFRVRNQNSLVVALPKQVAKATVLGLTITYRGHVAPQAIDREAIEVGQRERQEQDLEDTPPLLEPVFLYSNRSYWYPQGDTSSYATATLRVRVPRVYACVASGEAGVPSVEETKQLPETNELIFRALQPVRYLSLFVTRLLPIRTAMVGPTIRPMDTADSEAPRAGVFYHDVELRTMASPRMRSRAQVLTDKTIDVMRFYAALLGDCPYPALTLAVVERELPGGHSPAYLAVVSEQAYGSRLDWRSDPASFGDFPEFFIAHELAHQWWGQAVGWKNYHEQWLSEGLAQYFAAMYAERARGKEVFGGVIRRMQEWGVKKSDQAPVYLGYRAGHIRHEPQVFRAIIYNKSAVVLHMLRRLIGDDAFFGGLRRFYFEWRFRKAGSDDLRRAFEATSGRSLGRFFDQWIYDSHLPHLKFASRVETSATSGRRVAAVRFEQIGEAFDVPVTVTIDYADRPAVDVVVPVTEPVTELEIPVEGRVRRVEVNRDQAALARIDK